MAWFARRSSRRHYRVPFHRSKSRLADRSPAEPACQVIARPLSPSGAATAILAAPEVDIGRCQIIQALVIALVIVVRDEGLDLGFETARTGTPRRAPSSCPC